MRGVISHLKCSFATLGNPLALAGRRFSSLAREHPLLSELSGEYRFIRSEHRSEAGDRRAMADGAGVLSLVGSSRAFACCQPAGCCHLHCCCATCRPPTLLITLTRLYCTCRHVTVLCLPTGRDVTVCVCMCDTGRRETGELVLNLERRLGRRGSTWLARGTPSCHTLLDS